MMAKQKEPKAAALRIGTEVARQIRQHARSNRTIEVCGVLIGGESDGLTTVEACIAGANAEQGGAHVTFTQDTWEHIYKIKDRDYPDGRIVGWYHSHPGFGVFLSDHDTFIHQNFFSSPNQVAWVFDPHSDEEGCFGWKNGRLERVAQFAFVDERGGESANSSSRMEVANSPYDAEDEPGVPIVRVKGSRGIHAADEDAALAEKDPELSKLTSIVSNVFSHLIFLFLGGVLVWYLLPRILVMPVPVDPNTGRPLGPVVIPPDGKSSGQPSTPPAQTDPKSQKSGDGH
jgi:proteasome lid subunit RPN8/RPN11